MQLSIILLTFNSQDTIEQCVKSLTENYKKSFEKKEFEIILADNDSTDDTRKRISSIKSKYSKYQIHVLHSKKNLGFAAGINNAAKNANGTFLLILNPDTIVLNNNLLRMLDYANEDEHTAVMGGRLEDKKGRVEKSAGVDFSLAHIFALSLGIDKIIGMRFAPDSIQEVNWVSGGCMLVRKKIFTDVQGFDEKYFMYVEDADLCKRVRDLGYSVVYFPEFKILHDAHASSSKDFAITNIYKGLKTYSKKFLSTTEQILVQFLLRSKARVLIALGSLFGKKELQGAYTQAIKNT